MPPTRPPTAAQEAHSKKPLTTPAVHSSSAVPPAGNSAQISTALREAFPEMRTAEHYAAARAALRRMGGAVELLAELTRLGYAHEGKLTTGTTPFNVFARVASGVMVQPGMDKETARLGKASERFIIACNRPENDEHWESGEAEWVGKASMSKHHRFMLVRDLSWNLFNVIAFGMEDDSSLRKAVAMLEEMEAAARMYVAASDGWSSDIGLYFHMYGHSSVNSLHLHIVDVATKGPTFDALAYKNLPLTAVLQVLRAELKPSMPKCMVE